MGGLILMLRNELWNAVDIVDCPRRTFAYCVHVPSSGSKVRQCPPERNFTADISGIALKLADLQYPVFHLLIKRPQKSAYVRDSLPRTFFNFLWTIVDIRGHSWTGKNPRYSATDFFQFFVDDRRQSWTFADWKISTSPPDITGLSRTFADSLSQRWSTTVRKHTVLRQTFADFCGRSQTFADVREHTF